MGTDEEALDRIERRLNAIQAARPAVPSLVLQQIVSTVRGEMKSVAKSLTDEMAELRRGQRAHAEQLTALSEDLADLRADVRRAAVMTAAQNEVARLETRTRDRFRLRDEVRATARSLVGRAGPRYASDLAGHELVRHITGADLFREPDYWLAPALFAVAADLRGDRERQTAGWSLAQPHDEAKADLFCALVSARLGRSDTAAALAMGSYLGRVDPDALGREFVHVLNALAEKELGEKAFGHAYRRLLDWSERFLSAPGNGYVEFCADRILLNHTEPDEGRYGGLPAAVPEWERVAAGWRAVSACGATALLLRGPGPGDRRHGLPHTHLALHALIEQPEPDELACLREIRHWELVLKHRGDTAAAEAEALIDDPYSERAPFATLMVEAAFGLGDQVGPEARRLAQALVRPWLAEAGDRVAARAEAARPSVLELRIGDWSGRLATEDPDEEARLADDLAAHLRDRSEPVTPRLPQIVLGVFGAVTLLVGLVSADGSGRLLALLAGLVLLAPIGWELAVRVPRDREVASDRLVAETEAARDRIAALTASARLLLDDWDAEAARGRDSLGKVFAELPGAPG